MPDPAEPRFIVIGRISRPHGLAGEVVVEVLTDFPQRFDSLETVYLGDADQADAYQVSSCRWHKDRVLLSIEGFSDRNAVERLRDQLVQLPIEEAMPLAEDEYYAHQLIGLDVLTVDGQDLGRISDVLYTKANDVFVVLGPQGEILLPAIADVVEGVDLEKGLVTVRLMPGLI